MWMSVLCPSLGGYYTKFSVAWLSMQIKWTQSDLRFCKNEWSKDLKSMKKGSIGLKIKEKIDTKCLKSRK